ncbi:MAG: MarR family winged helix-turn-helix transcriptional regulator [Paracoccaceae bacterium]
MKHSELPSRAQDMFCHSVYVASHVINRAYTPHLKKLGLTYPQYITLTLLWEKDGQSVGALAGQLRMETSTLTPLIKRLEALGHVQRRRGETDERQVFVHLTGPGRALQAQAPGITACMVEGTGLTTQELDSLQALLGRLSDGLQPG